MTQTPSTLGVAWSMDISSNRSVRRIKDIAKIVNGYPFDSGKFDVEGMYPLIRIRDLNSTWTETNYSGDWVDAAAVENGDVLIGMDGDFNVGTWQGGPALLNQRMCCVKGQSVAMSRYLAYALPRALQITNDLTYYTTVKHLSSLDVERITVPVPLGEELETVVNFLDDKTARIDALIAEKEQLVERLKEYRKSRITEAITKGLNPRAEMVPSGAEWLGEIPAHWQMKKLKHVGLAIIGLTYSPNDVVDAAEGTLVLRSSNVQGGRVTFDDNVYVKAEVPEKLRTVKGDLLICSRNGSRALIGKNATIDDVSEGVTFGAFMTIFRSPFNGFLRWSLNSHLFDFQSASFFTSTINQLTTGNLNSFEIPFPPEVERNAIAKYLFQKSEQIGGLIENATEHISRLREYRSSLISAAVTGQLDVSTFKEAA